MTCRNMLRSAVTLQLLSLGLGFTRISSDLLRVRSFLPCRSRMLDSSKFCVAADCMPLDRPMSTTSNSVHSDQVCATHDIPMSAVIRPLPSVLEEAKVRSLMETLQNSKESDRVPAIDILWIIGREGGNYYYAFGGCHRWEAHQRLGRETIRAKLVQSTVQDLRTYLGASTPDLK